MKWFKHYTKAHRDTKIKKLINEFGADGYAVYFYSLELIADSLESDNITFQLEDDAQLIGQYLKIDTLRVELIMKKCINLELFGISESGYITCMKMAKFLDERYTRNPELINLIKSDKITSIKTRLSEDKVKTIGDIPHQIRLDKIRIDKNKEEKEEHPKQLKNIIPPTLDMVVDYCKERGNKVNAQKFIDHYTANGWKVGKNKMIDWQASIRNNWEKDNYNNKKEFDIKSTLADWDRISEDVS